MQTATVKWFNAEKGYGFLVVAEGKHKGMDVFAHYSAIQTEGYRTLAEGEKVTCEIMDGQKGPIAQNIQKVAQ